MRQAGPQDDDGSGVAADLRRGRRARGRVWPAAARRHDDGRPAARASAARGRGSTGGGHWWRREGCSHGTDRKG